MATTMPAAVRVTMPHKTPAPYQLLPRLSADEWSRLTDSIRERGVLVPVLVDEHGAVLDGHHRLLIAESLGIDCPRQTRSNLDEHEKRLLAVSLNVDRRQMSDTELTALGGRIKPDIAARAEINRLANLKQGEKSPIGANAPIGKTRDEVARSVGLGSGDTFERNEKVLDEALELRIVTKEQLAVDRPPDVPPPPDMRELKHAVKHRKKHNQADAIRREPPPLPEGPFRVIVADPPWAYDTRADDGTHRAANPYPSMSVASIASMAVAGMAHDDCILWLWTTNAHMREAFGVVDAWGFQSKTILTWVKNSMGTGDWLRGQTEHCLMAVRGKPIVTLTNETTALHGPLRAHSQKPDEFFALVERLCPGSKVELFARSQRPGWSSWGAKPERRPRLPRQARFVP